jgi:hypothetical protein
LDDPKKPGQRDISDLKARLGLKKTAAMPAAQPAAAPQASTPSPVAQSPSGPTAAPAQRAIPSPFGQPAPAPQPAAPPPDPRRDPFAQQQAANLAAFYGVGQVLPGSAESVSDAPISKPKPWGRIAFFGLVGAVAFGVGNACGRITNARVEFNRTIDQSGQIREEVERIQKQLSTITDKINGSALTRSGGVDLALAKDLGDLDLKKPDQQKLFHTNYSHLEDIAIDRLFNYYNHSIMLFDLITLHAKKTDNDSEAIQRAAQSSSKGGEKNYGVILQAQGGLQVAEFVEMGNPTCPDPAKTDCAPNEWKGFKYRVDAGGGWGERPLKGAINSIVMPLHKTPLFNTVAAGNPDILALRDYGRRMDEIKALLGALAKDQKEVLGDMKRASERPKVFTF